VKSVIIRGFQDEDENAFLALHHRAFGPHWSRAHWRWRFRENPLGRTDLLGAFDGSGRCLASYGGVTLPFTLEGREALATNQSDVAIEPGLRRGLGGSRLLAEITQRFFEHCGRNVQLIWGFPEPGLLRIVTRFADVHILRDVVFLVRPVTRPPTSTCEVLVHPLARCGPEVTELWARCDDVHRTAVCRNASYLEWRFVRHPGVDYTVLGARDARSGELRGIAVLRSGGWDASVVSLCDWLVPRDDRDAEQALVAWVVAEAARRGHSHVVGWFPAPQLQFHRFQVDHGFFAQATPYQQGVRWWVPGITRRWLHEHWYQTLGDLDFF
jgi:hypothetical protein